MSFGSAGAEQSFPLGAAVTIEFLGPLAVAVAGSRHLRDIGWVVLAATGVVLEAKLDRIAAALKGPSPGSAI